MGILFLLLLSILMQLSHLAADSRQHVTAEVRRKNNPNYFNIGGVLSNMESQMFFKETISVSKTIFKISVHLIPFVLLWCKGIMYL